MGEFEEYHRKSDPTLGVGFAHDEGFISASWVRFGGDRPPAAGIAFRSGSNVSSSALGASGQVSSAANGDDATISGFNVDSNTAGFTSLPGFPLPVP